MQYSDVVKQGLILPKKKKYTMRDVKNVMTDSLFTKKIGRTWTLREAIFIVKCSATYHDTDYSNSLIGYDAGFYPIS